MGMIPVVTEINPVKALKAITDGFQVLPMDDAAKLGDVFITVTGNRDVLCKRHFLLMKDNVVLANSGHFKVEISLDDLGAVAKAEKRLTEDIREFTLGNGHRLLLLAEGRLANLACSVGEGHPSEVMSLSFCNQALAVEYFVKHKGRLQNKLYNIPSEIDQEIARLMLNSKGVSIDVLTDVQKKYLESWQEG